MKEKKLNKPFRTPQGPKKFSVYVKDGEKVKKVNFGSQMEIKRDNPERRKSFRARHKCDTAKDKTSARYWSCKMWESGKSVSEYLNEEDANIIDEIISTLNVGNPSNFVGTRSREQVFKDGWQIVSTLKSSKLGGSPVLMARKLMRYNPEGNKINLSNYLSSLTLIKKK